jgi:hypothetical protein
MPSLFILTVVLVSNLSSAPIFIQTFSKKSDCQVAALKINASPEMQTKQAHEKKALAVCLSPAGFGGVDEKTT